MDDTLMVIFNQRELDALTDLIDRAVKNPSSGGLQVLDNASLVMGKLRVAVMQKQANAAAAVEDGQGAA